MNVVAQKSVDVALRAWQDQEPTVVFSGDCMDLLRSVPDGSISLTITSPPYCMGKEYETSNSISDFIAAHKLILPQIVRVTRDGGSICWQVGYHVEDGRCEPLDYLVFDILRALPGINLRNRIMWTFGHGLHSQRRFSGRHETVLWFTKGNNYYFDLDAVRVPQKYPGKRHYKGAHRGEFSGNPKGKNPSDVWEIPNVKANHIEKTGHPCQFPVGLAERLVRGLCPKDGLVFDPYMGSASTGVAAVINGRRFLGAETEEKYVALACDRLSMACAGTVQYRPVNQPIHVPSGHEAVARRPAHFVETLS
ncbi:MAG TPA: site-specific DNA-methyltransferase [Candidatus Aquilonibacter sp.]|jgi:adenine-specific DNA-methyltransferase|nr:site-specific DNA-methyltransferase [Candidatus Aquilonibacter sp.]